jgi:hypothetical protein
MVTRYADQLAAASATREPILNAFAEPVIGPRLLAAIDG